MGLDVLDLPVVEVVLAAEVALPHAVVLVASTVVLDAVTVGGLRHHKHMVLFFFRRRQSALRRQSGGCTHSNFADEQWDEQWGGLGLVLWNSLNLLIPPVSRLAHTKHSNIRHHWQMLTCPSSSADGNPVKVLWIKNC